VTGDAVGVRFGRVPRVPITTALKAATFEDVVSNTIAIRSFTIADTGFVKFQAKASLWPDSLDALEARRWAGYDRMFRGIVAPS
jgi:hypothetical protein